MYKLKDLQGVGAKEDRIYATKEEVRADLASYHSQDLQLSAVYELEDLLEIGEWELLEMPAKTTSGEWDNHN